ncbi:MAG TPA: phosphodiester glycosidase family protein [bacterium]|nr:phosphodiester glycosidase family protein [bacterium]
MNLPKLKLNLKISRVLKIIFLISLVTFFSVFVYINVKKINEKVTKIENSVSNISKTQENLKNSIDVSLYEDHLKLSQQINLLSEADSLKTQIEELSSIKDNQDYQKIQDIYKSYGIFVSNLDRNIKVKIDTKEYEGSVSKWGEMLINKDFDNLKGEIDTSISKLDEAHEKYLASIPKPVANQVSGGGNYMTVDTDRGKFGVYLIKVALSDVKVITASANGDDCKDNCPTKSLAEHVKDNGGFAGMNGAYFCPPDYSSCSGKINSSDYAFYKSSSDKWLNKGALSWGDTGLATFNGSSAKFYKKSSDYGGGSVTAGISNYPSLLHGGDVVINSDKLTSYQKDVKGARGAIGVGDSNLYLAIISNATVVDAAYVMKALGAKDALNLDGGGSSALYLNGSYLVGPGRSLPNAIVLVK